MRAVSLFDYLELLYKGSQMVKSDIYNEELVTEYEGKYLIGLYKREYFV